MFAKHKAWQCETIASVEQHANGPQCGHSDRGAPAQSRTNVKATNQHHEDCTADEQYNHNNEADCTCVCVNNNGDDGLKPTETHTVRAQMVLSNILHQCQMRMPYANTNRQCQMRMPKRNVKANANRLLKGRTASTVYRTTKY